MKASKQRRCRVWVIIWRGADVAIHRIVGPLAQRKGRAFAAALAFAKEYAIVAASSDHRPCVPPGSVVLEGAPRNMQAVFRRWDESSVPTDVLMSGKVKSAGAAVVVPLDIAVAAIRSNS